MKKILFITAIMLGTLTVKAQLPQPDPDTTAKHFLIVASIKNLQEVSAGQQAVAQARNPEVKMLGRMMIKDHGQAEQQLLALAKRKNISLPAAATGGIQPDLLLKNAGPRFDKMYVLAMAAGHGNAVEEFVYYAVLGLVLVV